MDNYSVYGPNNIVSRIDYIEETTLPDFSQTPIVAIATYVNNPAAQSLIKNGNDIDLSVRRQELMVDGHRQGVVDVYGRGWPAHMNIRALAASRRLAVQA